MKLASALGGLAGATTLSILNESVRKLDKDAPKLDLLGMNAVAKLIKGPKGVPVQEKLQPVSLAGDIISNALYYGMANAVDKKSTLIRGALLGLGAGVGAITIPKKVGLDESAEYASTKTKVLTIAWYVIGGLVAAAVINLFDNKK